MANSRKGKAAATSALKAYCAAWKSAEPSVTNATDLVADLLLTFSEEEAEKILDNATIHYFADRREDETD